MKCINCGCELPEGARFCGNCGTPQPEHQQEEQSQDNRCNKDFVLIVEERMMPMLYSAVSVERI